MPVKRRIATIAVAATMLTLAPPVAADAHPVGPVTTRFPAFSSQGSGSTIGPDGALYVTDGPGHTVWRINPRTGVPKEFAHGLPEQQLPIGGAMDVAFLGRTAYVLVTMVSGHFLPSGEPYGIGAADGIYRVERDGSVTLVADIGAWVEANQPDPQRLDYFLSTGVQYSLEPYLGGFLVTDGHHNRLLRATLDGRVSLVAEFGDVVPTGLETVGPLILMAEAGPVPHEPETAKVVALTPRSKPLTIASGHGTDGPGLTVDVERGPGLALYALLQGEWDNGDDPANAGLPASPDTGALARIEWNGKLTPIVTGLNQPTSLEFIGDTAFVIGLDGVVTRIDHVSGAH